MKNSDKPVYPLQYKGFPSNDDVLADANINAIGLTKREYFAAIAMQGICSHNLANWSNGDIAINSLDIADELLKQLEK